MRLFFALWPDAAVRRALDAEAAQQHALRGGRRTRADTLHLTLVFLGELAETRLPGVLAAAAAVTAQPFEMCFDRAGCWRHNGIAHLGCGSVAPALLDLVDRLETRLDAAGIPFDRRAYVPHVTLLRRADCSLDTADRPADALAAKLLGKTALEVETLPKKTSNPALKPIRWPARDFVLVKSSLRSGGALYEQLGRWPLL